MAELRIFLTDDHAVVREGLKSLINSQSDMIVIGEASNGIDACQQIPPLVPDVVVMDVSMPKCSGVQATEQLSKDYPQIKILALTFHEDKAYIRQLLAAGASGYVLKRAAAQELIHAIRIVASGKIYLDPDMAGQVVVGFVRRSADSIPPTTNTLSERELEIAKLIASGYSNKEIASNLDLSVRTVETYRARGLEKLGLTSRAQLVQYALQQGWLNGP